MADYLVTRHAGAVEWARRRNLSVDWKSHFTSADLELIGEGDSVIGPLPIHLIAAVNARGGRYFHIEMDLPEDARPRDLPAEDMERYGAELVEYRAERIAPEIGDTR